MKNSDVYQKITDFVVKQIEKQEILPWQKTWTSTSTFERPMNYATKTYYKGTNVFLLSFMPFSRPYYVTYKQAQNLGGQVLKGSESTPVVYWNRLYKHLPTNKVMNEQSFKNHPERGNSSAWKVIPLLKYFNVFNIDQIEGIDYDLPEIKEVVLNENEKIEAAELTINSMPKKPVILNDPSRAFYRPSTDTVHVPKIEQFNSSDEYYGTLFHELVHSTGHESRLNRKAVSQIELNNSKSDYGKEELVAEFGAAFLNAIHGIETTHENSVAYLNGWLKAIKGDNTLLVNGSAQAQRAADFILNEA